MSFRVLHVDDEPDIRRVVALALGIDPQLSVGSCASGSEAVALAADWLPDLILCDVMMPVMDGPATLARLRENPRTAEIPVVFMTARAQGRELERFKALGASGVIAKPFSGKALRESVRGYLREAEPAAANDSAWDPLSDTEIAGERDEFRARLRTDAATLLKLRAALCGGATSSPVLEEVQTIAHKLAGAAGMFGFENVSRASTVLEESIMERHSAGAAAGSILANLDALADCIGRE